MYLATTSLQFETQPDQDASPRGDNQKPQTSMRSRGREKSHLIGRRGSHQDRLKKMIIRLLAQGMLGERRGQNRLHCVGDTRALNFEIALNKWRLLALPKPEEDKDEMKAAHEW